MLVLSRKRGESVVIGEPGETRREMTITVLEIRGGKVRLGFDADPCVAVQRSEIWARIHTGERTGELQCDHMEDSALANSP